MIYEYIKVIIESILLVVLAIYFTKRLRDQISRVSLEEEVARTSRTIHTGMDSQLKEMKQIRGMLAVVKNQYNDSISFEKAGVVTAMAVRSAMYDITMYYGHLKLRNGWHDPQKREATKESLKQHIEATVSQIIIDLHGLKVKSTSLSAYIDADNLSSELYTFLAQRVDNHEDHKMYQTMDELFNIRNRVVNMAIHKLEEAR